MAYSKTNWQDYPNTDTPITANALNNIEDGIEELENKITNQVQMVKAYMNSNYTVNTASATETLPLSIITNSKGTDLTILNNGVQIGENINYVLVSGQIYWYQNISNYETIAYVFKNEESQLVHNQKLTDNYEHVSLPTIIIPVTEGDIVTIRVQFQSSGSSSSNKPIISNNQNGTFLTVIGFE